jgi:hypothetical protein
MKTKPSQLFLKLIFAAIVLTGLQISLRAETAGIKISVQKPVKINVKTTIKVESLLADGTLDATQNGKYILTIATRQNTETFPIELKNGQTELDYTFSGLTSYFVSINIENVTRPLVVAAVRPTL